MDFAVPADHRVKLKENEKRDKYLDFCRELTKKTNKKKNSKKQTMELESDGDTNSNWCAR